MDVPTEHATAKDYIRISDVHGAAVVSVRIISLGDRSAGALRARLREAIRRSSGRVVVDFSGVADVASGCITALMEASVQASAFGGRVVLANLPAGLKRVIDTAGLRTSLPHAPSLQAAVQMVARPRWTWLGPIPDVA